MKANNAPLQAFEDAILRVQDLHVYFYTDLGVARALNGVSFDVPKGKVMGLVGESGCGKSVTSLAILQLVPHPGRIVRGRIYLNAASNGEVVEITKLDRNGPEMRSLRGNEVSMIFQEPMTSLNPSYTVGDQIMEAITLHQGVRGREAEARAVDILDRVGMPNPAAVVKRYPHELSGGMRQRAMVAMALSCTPSLLIADEPTTALDVTTEAQILDLMRELQADLGTSIIFITHNLGVVAQMCDEVAVMYLGRIVEQAPVEALFFDSKHPYTQALLRSIPHVGSRSKTRLKPIRGVVPDPYSSVSGCSFHPRCDSFMAGQCDRHVPALTEVDTEHTVRCFLYSDEEEGEGNGSE